MLTQRQKELLQAIINEYIKTAEPVGSVLLVDKYKLDFSSATVRNEMMELVAKGFLEQPHTSAGRIPTEQAYKFYVSEGFKIKKLTQIQQDKLIKTIKNRQDQDKRQELKDLAKGLAELSGELILLAFQDNDFYYTGLTNLFSQPEFRNQEIVCNISTVIDHLDARLAKLFHKVDDQAKIFIGSQNPIDQNLSLITVKISQKGPLIALLGPMRMAYSTNVALLEYSKGLIQN
ncbi:MAG: hypothetical protein ABH896_02610 [Candidatus Jacksonbacteria bacterium]